MDEILTWGNVTLQMPLLRDIWETYALRALNFNHEPFGGIWPPAPGHGHLSVLLSDNGVARGRHGGRPLRADVGANVRARPWRPYALLAGGLVASLRGKAPAEFAPTIRALLNEPGIRACVDALRG